MKKDVQYRWSIKTENVYSFSGFNWAGTLASYKNEVSGFVRKTRIPGLLEDLKAKGVPYSDFKLVESGRYWKNFNQYWPVINF